MAIIIGKRKSLLPGLFGRRFDNYFSDDMSNLTTPVATDIETQLNSYSVGTTDTWLFRGYFLANTTATNWRFRTNSDDASYVWIGTDSTGADTALDPNNAVVDNGGLHGAQTRTSNNISLTGGVFYPLAVVIGNNTGPGVLTFSFSSNGGASYSTNGNGLFFYNPYAENGFNLS